MFVLDPSKFAYKIYVLSAFYQYIMHSIYFPTHILLSKYILYTSYLSVYGKDVVASNEQPLDAEPMHPGRNTVTYEARQIKALMLHLI